MVNLRSTEKKVEHFQPPTGAFVYRRTELVSPDLPDLKFKWNWEPPRKLEVCGNIGNQSMAGESLLIAGWSQAPRFDKTGCS